LKNAVERAVIMSRSETIGVNDVMPRHLRSSGQVPSSVTIQVGATVSDARRQLVLRTFASTGGDLGRTAKLLGVSEDEVRRDLIALISGATGEDEDNGKGPAGSNPSSPAKKPPTKKR